MGVFKAIANVRAVLAPQKLAAVTLKFPLVAEDE